MFNYLILVTLSGTTSRHGKARHAPPVDMDSYIEDLLSDEEAINVMIGSLTDGFGRYVWIECAYMYKSRYYSHILYNRCTIL